MKRPNWLSRSAGPVTGLGLALALLAAGCGNRTPKCEGSACLPTTGNIVIEGAGITKEVNEDGTCQPVTVQLKAYIQDSNGGKTDVTEDVQWLVVNTDDRAVAQISKSGLFQTPCPLPFAGPIPVAALAPPRYTQDTVTLHYKAPDVVDPSAPPGANGPQTFNSSFSVTDPNNPVILYPLPGALAARNISQMTFQWIGSAQDKIFRIRAWGGELGDPSPQAYNPRDIDISYYVGNTPAICTPFLDENMKQKVKCKYKPADKDWLAVSVTGGKDAAPMNVDICGVEAATAPLHCASVQQLFSPEAVRGGLYYFSPTVRGIKRLPFGAATASPFITKDKTDCVGCHTLSLDGKQLAATFRGSDGLGGVVSASDPTKYTKNLNPTTGRGASNRWNFSTFSPDGKLLLTNWQGKLLLYNALTGERKGTVPDATVGGLGAIMPEWAPDGSSVAFVQIPPGGKLGKDFDNTDLVAGDWVAGNVGSIAVMRWDDTNEVFAPATVVVPAANGEFHYFPTWSPDSKWLAFVTATAPGASPTAGTNLYGKGGKSPDGYCMTYDQETARLRLVQVDSSTPVPVEMTAATHQTRKTSSWPKFSPFAQGNLQFLTFSAKFDYGFTVTDGQTPQLWMAGIDIAKAQQGIDPSYPPVWLPFQDPTQKNHSGIWTQEVSCQAISDCPADFTCDANNHCIPICGENATSGCGK